MPRQARKRAESGIYHIMLRGINQQQIFEDAENTENRPLCSQADGTADRRTGKGGYGEGNRL